MAIQFTTASLRRTVSEPEACPKCGASFSGINGDPSCDAVDGAGGRCWGYGPVPAGLVEDHAAGLEVAVDAARVLLVDVLGYAGLDLSVGTLDPHDLLKRIVSARARNLAEVRSVPAGPEEEFVATSDFVGVRPSRFVDCGVSSERLRRYLDRLAVIATAAAENGDPVDFE